MSVPILILPAGTAPQHGDCCPKCRYSAKQEGDLICRRFPPQATIMMVPAPPPRLGAVELKTFCSFPLVNPDFWCGMFEPKEQRAH